MEPIRGKIEITDTSYRYKMEKINFQKERTRTCINNLQTISSDLKFPYLDLIVAFLKKKLAIAITEKDGKIYITNDINLLLINNALYEFIEYFILCKLCRFPELDYVIVKNHLGTKCRSCGQSSFVDSNQHTEKIIKLLEIKLVANTKLNNKKRGALEIHSKSAPKSKNIKQTDLLEIKKNAKSIKDHNSSKSSESSEVSESSESSESLNSLK
jgi:translation initiation factor 5